MSKKLIITIITSCSVCVGAGLLRVYSCELIFGRGVGPVSGVPCPPRPPAPPPPPLPRTADGYGIIRGTQTTADRCVCGLTLRQTLAFVK